jgi:hypothetical protein
MITNVHELLANKVPDVIDVCMERITMASAGSMLRRRLVFATQRLVHDISRAILAGKAKIDEIVNRRTLGPGVGFGSTLEVPISINFDRVEPIGVHSRRVKHDIVGGAVAVKHFQTRDALD